MMASSGNQPLAPLSRAKKIPRTGAQYGATTGNIAAIDFGTSSVSLAYITKGNEEVVTMVMDPQSRATRVSNAALFKIDDYQVNMISFGGTAQSQFISMKPSDHIDHIYFERIKMLMKREQSVDIKSQVESFTGEQYYLVEVIAFILQHLKELLIDHLSRTAVQLKATDFDWVITVPAIWDERGKKMMREAAYMAGLLTESDGDHSIKHFTSVYGYYLPVPDVVNPDKLSLALEPESAALYSQEMVGQQIEGAGAKAAISRPSQYMVIDIGGGTVDITAHFEKDDGGIIVENIPTGNAWGGTRVNEEFSKLLQNLVKDSNFRRFLTSSTTSEKYAQSTATLNRILYKEFEEQKLAFGQCKTDFITIILPGKFIKFYMDELIDGSEEIYGVEYDDDSDTLYLEKHVVECQLFGPAIDGIISCTLDAIKDNDFKADTFYLVGGFGGCKYVHQKVTAAIEKLYESKDLTCHVIVPPSPELAVATGAAIWRRNPEKIMSRRADATYGTGVAPQFDPAIHDEHYKYYHEEDKTYRCNNVFNVFLEKGELIKNDEVFTTKHIPYSQIDTKMHIKIFTTPEVGVQYIEDKDGDFTVATIGDLVVDIPNPDNLPKEKREVDITIDFSGTEIQAKAKYCVTGEEVKTACNFLSKLI